MDFWSRECRVEREAGFRGGVGQRNVGVNLKVEGAKQEETTEWWTSFGWIGTCESRGNTVVGGGLEEKVVLHK